MGEGDTSGVRTKCKSISKEKQQKQQGMMESRALSRVSGIEEYCILHELNVQIQHYNATKQPHEPR